jgi:hypothetical protein
VFHLTRESTTWDTTAIFCSAIGLIYAIYCFVRWSRDLRFDRK